MQSSHIEQDYADVSRQFTGPFAVPKDNDSEPKNRKPDLSEKKKDRVQEKLQKKEEVLKDVRDRGLVYEDKPGMNPK